MGEQHTPNNSGTLVMPFLFGYGIIISYMVIRAFWEHYPDIKPKSSWHQEKDGLHVRALQDNFHCPRWY